MNKVITINLGGNAYQLEDAGYDALRAYLETAATRLAGNPDRDEILTDIERAIADKFRALLGSHKTVVETREVAAVLSEMGPIEAEPGDAPNARASDASGSASTGTNANPNTSGAGWTGTAGASGPGSTSTEPPPINADKPRRLYRITDDAMFAGVCSGIAAYLHLDPTLIRIAFVLLTIFAGSGVIIYIVLALVIPEAVSPEEKAAAAGPSPTAQEFIRRARAGYYDAVRGFPDRQAYREWKRRFRREMRANARQWRHHWRYSWRGAYPPPPPMSPIPPVPPIPPLHPSAVFLMPLISVLHGVILIAWLSVLVSILSSGDIFGHGLPFDIPEWVAIVGLCMIYGMVVSPLKAARHALYWNSGGPRYAWHFVFFTVGWFVVIVVLLGVAHHHYPELREAVQNIPTVFHQAVNDITNWWHSK